MDPGNTTGQDVHGCHLAPTELLTPTELPPSLILISGLVVLQFRQKDSQPQLRTNDIAPPPPELHLFPEKAVRKVTFVFYLLCVCVHVCVSVFFACLAYVPVPTEAGKPGVGSPATGFIGGCEPPVLVLETSWGASGRIIHVQLPACARVLSC